ncbi:MAG: hypothetical protein IPL40_07875 [Proteobacteria bacterium]|nr:hypothetical protein [Pseudomonadota bacterium]
MIRRASGKGWRGSVALIGLVSLVAVQLGCSNDDNEIEPYGFTTLNMLEFETREVMFRYSNDANLPVGNAKLRCDLKGFSNGALLDRRVTLTDASGVGRLTIKAKYASTFRIECDAEDAREKVSIAVYVAKEFGGRLRVVISRNSAAQALTAQVMVVENLPCVAFDPLRPPAPSGDIPNANVPGVPLDANAATLNFVGLRPSVVYSVVAIGKLGEQIVAGGCRDQLSMNQDQIDRTTPLTTTVELEDFVAVPPDPSALVLTTLFDFQPVVLRGLGGLLERMSDGVNDPADYLLMRMQLRDNNGLMGKLLAAYRSEVATLLARDATASANRMSLRRIATSLQNASNIQLHTTMLIRDELTQDNGTPRGQLTATHKFFKFTADLGAGTQRDFFLRDGQRVFGGTTLPRLEATTTITLQQADRISIAPHELTLPIADAILGNLLLEQFGTARFDQVIQQSVQCSNVATVVDRWINSNVVRLQNIIGLGVSALTRIFISGLCEDAIQDVALEVQQELMRDLQAARIDETLKLEGSAGVLRAADGRTIDRLNAGSWVGIGSFSGRRQ